MDRRKQYYYALNRNYEFRQFKDRVLAAGGTLVDEDAIKTQIASLKALGIYDAATQITIPGAGKSGILFNIKPTNADYTVSRNSVKNVLNRYGRIEQVAANVPAFEYDSVLGRYVISSEPQRTNNFLNSVWAGGGVTPTNWIQVINDGTRSNVVSSLGNSCTAISFSVTNQRNFIQQAYTTLANTKYCISCYVEASNLLSVSQIVNESGGLSGTVKSYLVDNISVAGSYIPTVPCRVSLIYSNTVGGVVNFRFGAGVDANATGSCTLSRPQLEAGDYATSSIETTTATVTRLRDDITQSVTALSEGAFLIEFDYTGQSSVDRYLFSAYLSSGNVINIWIAGASNVLYCQIYVGGSAQFSQSKVLTVGKHKALITFKQNDSVAYVDGTALAAVDTSCTMPAYTTYQLGYISAAPHPIAYAVIFDKRLTASECAQITTLSKQFI